MSKTKITADIIRDLRKKTGAPVMRTKKVLEELKGDTKKAEIILREEGFEKVAKRKGRETGQGVVGVYEHYSGKVVGVVELLCETDFVARNELFVELSHNLAMQVASMDPRSSDSLLEMDYIKDPSKKVAELVKEVIAKTGENIRVGKIFRLELGK